MSEELKKAIEQVVWEAMQFARGCSDYCWETQPNAHKIWAKEILDLIERSKQ